jgi:AraC-like DNA-binding protein
VPPSGLLFRSIRPGFDRIPAGVSRPRHAHLAPYATILLDGGFEQSSYVGRMRIEPGDVLIQPVLDRHDSRPRGAKDLRLLRLAWPFDAGLGGVYRISDVDLVIRTARRDPQAASELLHATVSKTSSQPVLSQDWPDLLAADIRARHPMNLTGLAHRYSLRRETLSRGFARTFGIAPRSFAIELKAREAWIRIVTSSDSLAKIAANLGYADQPHMTRAVRALTGTPPSMWRKYFGRTQSALSDLALQPQGCTISDTRAQ